MNALRLLKKYKKWIIFVLLILACIQLFRARSNNEPSWTTTVVERGDIRSLVSISGSVDAVGTAELSFPVTGILESIAVNEGDTVQKGNILASLVKSDLEAEYRDALASLQITEADRDELIHGIRAEDRDIAKTNVAIARAELERVTKEQDDQVMNAYRTLLSDDLAVFAENKERHTKNN